MSHDKYGSKLPNLTLGKTTDYVSEYDASLLQGVPRSLNRNALNLSNDNLPFFGEDIWYGYELSWLNKKGKPLVMLAEFRVPCISENIIESKSFKLYLNSFNQSQFSCSEQVLETLIKDLSAIAKAPVEVSLSKVDKCQALKLSALDAECIDDLDIEIKDYQVTPEYLINASSCEYVNEHLVSHLLKSNCLITNQPDWATIYIKYSGAKICREQLLKYLISFRQHNEFHEQCVERIFCDLMHFCQPKQLTIYARYTRRGGLDINPFRSTAPVKAPNARTLRQ